MKNVTISNREIATMAFDRLCKENKTDAAIRLAHAMLHSQSICLYCGYAARFHFSRETEMSEHRYRSIRNEIYGE